MPTIRKALCWAAAILMVAAAKRFGLFEAEAADVLLLVLPILAFMAITGRTGCIRRREAM